MVSFPHCFCTSKLAVGRVKPSRTGTSQQGRPLFGRSGRARGSVTPHHLPPAWPWSSSSACRLTSSRIANRPLSENAFRVIVFCELAVNSQPPRWDSIHLQRRRFCRVRGETAMTYIQMIHILTLCTHTAPRVF